MLQLTRQLPAGWVLTPALPPAGQLPGAKCPVCTKIRQQLSKALSPRAAGGPEPGAAAAAGMLAAQPCPWGEPQTVVCFPPPSETLTLLLPEPSLAPGPDTPSELLS